MNARTHIHRGSVSNQLYLLDCRQAIVCSWDWVENCWFSLGVAFVRECCLKSSLVYYSRNAIDFHFWKMKFIGEAVFSVVGWLQHPNCIVRKCSVWLEYAAKEIDERTSYEKTLERERDRRKNYFKKYYQKTVFLSNLCNLSLLVRAVCIWKSSLNRIYSHSHTLFQLRFELFCGLWVLCFCLVLLCPA